MIRVKTVFLISTSPSTGKSSSVSPSLPCPTCWPATRCFLFSEYVCQISLPVVIFALGTLPSLPGRYRSEVNRHLGWTGRRVRAPWPTNMRDLCFLCVLRGCYVCCRVCVECWGWRKWDWFTRGGCGICRADTMSYDIVWDYLSSWRAS